MALSRAKRKMALVAPRNIFSVFSPDGEDGARVGDLFMGLIYTCQLNQANPFDYLTQLQRHSDQVAASPQLWMPWNYRAGLSADESDQAVGIEPLTK